jgi:arginase family enzyme
MRFLDIDLDAFLNSVAYYRNDEGRLDAEAYQPWAEARLRDFLERQCGLSTVNPIPGWFVEEHDGAFDVMRALVGHGNRSLEVVHVDAHADLGLGDPSWVDLMRDNNVPIQDEI